jgi:glutathione synthase/RimK-type ligase-like ATP-grasp enzyme
MSFPPRVALATYSKFPALTDDDRPLVPALAGRGVEAHAVVWDDPHVDWTAFAAVVIRSCWDYHLRHDDFLAWVAALERAGVPVWNPPAVLRWNAEKTYLRDLAERGVPVVPTRWIERGSAATLCDVLHDAGWDRAVVKPAISASAHETWQTSRATAARDELRFRALVDRGRVLVQPFMEAIVSAGEWSLVFVGGAFSHAMLKRARAGDFRVQTEHGGTATPGDPGSHIIEQAGSALQAGPPGTSDSLYARVDGCAVDGDFVVMEVELIEPLLFLGWHPGAADRLADALVDRMR